MPLLTTVEVKETALWPQGDERDPLGIWGARILVTGDGDGSPSSIKVQVNIPAPRRGAYVYTCYSAIITATTQAIVAGSTAKCRLNTLWPDIDALAGVVAYSRIKVVQLAVSGQFTSPFNGPDQPMVDPQDRFLLLYDPRPINAAVTMVELENSVNVLNDVYAFECYGYYWDRSVMNAPGGPRHPGSS